MRRFSQISFVFVIFLTLSFVIITLFRGGIEISAETPEEKINRLRGEIEQYEGELSRLESQAATLSNQIAQYDAQIRLTTLKVEETEEKIFLLGGRINQLETSLEALSDAFASRAVQTYKIARLNQPFALLISAEDLSQAVSSFHYLQKIQEADRGLLTRLEEAQINYIDEKVDQEVLQKELESQKEVLGDQKISKAKLLEITKNDELRYQQLLTKARAEFDAIQAIIAGKGEETEVGNVGEGDKIASIIVGSSTCSSGGHVHFEVVKDAVHQNPANFLIPKAVTWDNSPDGTFSFSGSWQWPINDPIRITQGYGMTYYASSLKYDGGAPHTGIDMVNQNNYLVKAARGGTLYRGAIACGGGTLKYVRVEQGDGYDTYYLHVNY